MRTWPVRRGSGLLLTLCGGCHSVNYSILLPNRMIIGFAGSTRYAAESEVDSLNSAREFPPSLFYGGHSSVG